MSRININLGTPPSGTDGDPVRTAFEKTNAMFEELYKLTQGELSALNGVNLQTIVKPGPYYITNGVQRPPGAGNGYLFVTTLADANEVYQRFVNVNLAGSWEQVKLGGVWQGWKPIVYGEKVATNVDPVADRIMTTGFQGVGGAGVAMTDWTEGFKRGSGFFQANAAAANGPGPAGYNVTGINMMLNNGPIGGQLGVFCGDNRMVFRSAYNGFLPWCEVVHSYNALLDPATNAGGLMFFASNASGEVYKFASGLLICRIRRQLAVTVNNAATGVFFGQAPAWTFPHAFATPPVVSGGHVSPGVITWEVGNVPTASSVTPAICAMQSIASRTYTQDLTAIGRWK